MGVALATSGSAKRKGVIAGPLGHCVRDEHLCKICGAGGICEASPHAQFSPLGDFGCGPATAGHGGAKPPYKEPHTKSHREATIQKKSPVVRGSFLCIARRVRGR